MKSSVVKHEVREINRKLFAYDIEYESDSNENTFEALVSNIIQNYNPEDALANIPTILEIKDESINNDILEKVYLLDKKSVYIEVNNRSLDGQYKLAIIRKIKESGYKLIIEINEEDKVFTIAKLLADIIKIDIHKIPPALQDKNNRFTCKLLAYNVDSPEDFVIAESTHVSLYSGKYVGTSKGFDLDTSEHSNINFIDIIDIINCETIDIKELSRVVSRDSLMSAQVIRLSNSMYFKDKEYITSIEDAITRVGTDNLKRWIFLLQFSRNNDVPEEIIKTSYCRALMCKRIVSTYSKLDLLDGEAYMIGLFSTLPELTGKSMSKELSTLNISSKVENALVYREGIGGLLLNLVIAYEESDIDRLAKYISTFRINRDEIFKIYYQCIEEVRELWESMTEKGALYQ